MIQHKRVLTVSCLLVAIVLSLTGFSTAFGYGGGSIVPILRAQLEAQQRASLPATVGHIFTKTLNLGSRNQEVAHLQNALRTAGLFTGESTNYFGQVTRKALIAYQAKMGLKQTGTLNAETRAALNRDAVGVSATATDASIIASLQTLLQSLFNQLQALIAARR